MSASPHANGGLLRRALRMPNFRDYAEPVDRPATVSAMNTRPLGHMLRDIMARNGSNFRVFGPDENSSNKLDAINVFVCDKQMHLQYLDMDAAIAHCTKGLGIWNWASNDAGTEPDVVIVGCGDIPTREALAATALLREQFPDLKVRFINVVDLFRMTPAGEHPHGLSDRDFDSLFTVDRPIIFNFHGYPWLIHRLAYRRTNHRNLHVRGYKERGNINTPLELAIENEIDRFSLAIDVINRVPQLHVAGAHVKERLRDMQIRCRNDAHEHGVDMPEVDAWTWPY